MASDRKAPENFDPLDAALTDDEIARLRPASEWFAAQGLAMPTPRGRGRPKLEQTKVSVTMRLDPAVIDGFKRRGPGWQTRMGEVLAKSLHTSPELSRAQARRLAVKRLLLEKAGRRQRIRARVPRRANARPDA
ncbi:BrnA antitoxin family protein [Devosia sp.]|uniref:BrnA antitoxin family protein n=1 Tax=Devosia sp. TaxID=1871048 RepID=UPI002736A860|nr:BrnA antitoxin family protein [Devosia sp.]MDP2780280.1 BrnA antitoxin family protein [Devosia sp.]